MKWSSRLSANGGQLISQLSSYTLSLTISFTLSANTYCVYTWQSAAALVIRWDSICHELHRRWFHSLCHLKRLAQQKQSLSSDVHSGTKYPPKNTMFYYRTIILFTLNANWMNSLGGYRPVRKTFLYEIVAIQCTNNHICTAHVGRGLLALNAATCSPFHSKNENIYRLHSAFSNIRWIVVTEIAANKFDFLGPIIM